MPGWKERHAPDLGVTLVEMLAYAGDQLSYYQDAVATEAYLTTARQRASVRRHSRLVDYAMHDGASARTWLVFNSAEDVTLMGRAIDRWATLTMSYQDHRSLHNVILGMFTRAYDVIDRDYWPAHVAAA